VTVPAYEIRPVGMGRSSRLRPAVVIAATVVLVAVVVIKPWSWLAGPPPTPPTVAAPAALPASAAPPAVAAPIAAVPPTDPSPAWPAVTDGRDAQPAGGSRLPREFASLTNHAGTWGVGDAGIGPRIERDEPWADWAAVVPEAATDAPIRIVLWPGTGICAGVPALADVPLFFAITSPPDVAVDRPLVAWWTDGGRVASLDGSVRQISGAGKRGVGYLVRDDGAPWPAGRYEFHVGHGDGSFALTVCLRGD
jgi:hypothetical protein